ncbi:MAG: hypothetical protein WC867_00980 [Candidatus Pacearchaeota archaeon]|jgi:hypothetical protein
MKKEMVVILILFVSIFLITIISAQTGIIPDNNIERFFDWGRSSFGTIFAALFGSDVSDAFLFSKVLVFFLILAVSAMSLRSMGIFDVNRGALLLVSVVVSLLAVRSMGQNKLFEGILLPYGAFGAAIIVFLPILIYFAFVHTNVPGGFWRRMAWFAYGFIFLILFITRWYSGDLEWTVRTIYLGGIVAIVFSIIFDRDMHKYFQLADYDRAAENLERRAKLMNLEDLDRALKHGTREDIRHTRKNAHNVFSHGGGI